MKRKRPPTPCPAPCGTEAKAPETNEASCAVVGIGASAGGLKAFQELLDDLSPGTGAAYVLIAHLDPRHESLMSSILSKATTMPVEEARDGTRLERDHVYVIAPNTVMAMAGGALKLTPRSATRKHCIDHFMISLAEECGDRAVGVLLSGTASDGTAGLGAIKAEGGITFAQDDSAEYPEMPRNAIAAGYVDFVLPPKGIAVELSRVARHPYLTLPAPTAPSPPAGEDTGVLAKILRLLQQTTGVEFAGYKRATVERRIARRMALRRLLSLDEYRRALETDPDEVRALHNELLISVTSFFRDPGAFEALKTKVFPALLEGRYPQDPIRIWVPGCATGEEAYSIVIALLEFQELQGANVPIQVYATDVSEVAINKARAGLYDAGIEAVVSPERLRRFFARTERGHQVSKAVRDLIVFARQDLTRDPPFSRIDLVSCRNVLIYLGPALQKRAIPLFHYALRPDGFLLLGPSESVDRHADLFRPVDKKWRIYGRVSSSGAPRYDFGERNRQSAEAASSKKDGPGTELDLQDEADRALIARYVPAGVVIDEEGRVVEVRGETGPYLRPGPGKPSFNLYRMARPELAAEIDSAVRTAKKTGTRARRERVRLKSENGLREVHIEVIPLKGPAVGPRHYAVLFEEATPPPAAPARAGKAPKGARGRGPAAEDDRDRELAQMRDELRQNAEYQQAAVERREASNEELRSANEEILSSNEELQSTNEELETSKEELQSAYEELGTLNDELRSRNVELGLLTSDLQNILSSTQLPIAIVDTSFRLRRVTPPAERLLNVLQTDVGRRLTVFKINVDAKDLEKTLRTVMETSSPAVEEVRDTEGKWWALHVRPCVTGEQKIDGAVIVLVDIDARKTALGAAEEARDVTTAIVEAARDPLLILDRDLRVEMANAAFYETFQAKKGETEGRLIYDLGNGQWDIPRLRQLLEEVLPTHSSFADVEVEHDFETIGRKVMLLHGRRIVFRSGPAPRILLVIEDISERKDRETRERFLGEVSPALASSLDSASVLSDLAALSVPRLADLCFVDLIGEAAGSRDVIRTGRSELYPALVPHDIEGLAKDPAQLALLRGKGVRSAMIVPLGVRGRSFGAITFCRAAPRGPYGRDDLEWAEEWARRAAFAVENARLFGEAQEAIRSREQFLSVASHEMKTPLTALDLQVRLLLDGDHPDPCPLAPLRKSFQMLARQTAKFSKLIDQLLDLARIEGGKLEFQEVELDLAALCREVVGRFADALARAGTSVELHADRPVTGRFDRLRMDQVATNLISNAVKYGGGKPVEVRVEADGGMARIVVCDAGIGIAPEDQLKIFEKLERTVQARRYGGLGLGLYIVRRIVTHYGGAIRVESELGKGATFTVELPLDPAARCPDEVAAGAQQ